MVEVDGFRMIINLMSSIAEYLSQVVVYIHAIVFHQQVHSLRCTGFKNRLL